MGAAFFDLDGTITKKDTFLEFISYSEGRVKLCLCIFLNSPFIILFYFKLYSNQKLKERFFSFCYKGKLKRDVEKTGDDFGKFILPALCYLSALDVINWHKHRGHDIYIVTASSGIWLAQWCRENNFNLISTEFEVVDGRYSGKIEGKNCYGLEKRIRINRFIGKYEFSKTYGYGDSKADLHFLKCLNTYFLTPLNEKNVKNIWQRRFYNL